MGIKSLLDDRADAIRTVRESAREDMCEPRRKLQLRSVGRTRSSPAYSLSIRPRLDWEALENP